MLCELTDSLKNLYYNYLVNPKMEIQFSGKQFCHLKKK